MNFDFKNMLDQAKNMKAKMEQVKEEMKKTVVEGESGAGMVKVSINGAYQVLKIDISKEIIDPNESKMIEDLVLAAVNNALGKIADMNQSEMNNMASMMPNIPGLDLNL